MIFWVVAGVVQEVFCGDVTVNVIRFDLKQKAVGVCVQLHSAYIVTLVKGKFGYLAR